MKTKLLRKVRMRYKYEEHQLGSLKVLLIYMTGRNYDAYVRMRILDYARTYYKRYAWIRWIRYELKWQAIAIYYMLTFKSVTSYPRWFEIFLGVFGWICVGIIVSSLWMIKWNN